MTFHLSSWQIQRWTIFDKRKKTKDFIWFLIATFFSSSLSWWHKEIIGTVIWSELIYISLVLYWSRLHREFGFKDNKGLIYIPSVKRLSCRCVYLPLKWTYYAYKSTPRLLLSLSDIFVKSKFEWGSKDENKKTESILKQN